MTTLQIGPHDKTYYTYHSSGSETGRTFVFFNALTGDTQNWEALIGPMVKEDNYLIVCDAFDLENEVPRTV